MYVDRQESNKVKYNVLDKVYFGDKFCRGII